MANDVRRRGNWRIWAARLVGAAILVVGLVVAVGGAWLAALGGSLYYLPAGVALIVAGFLIMRRRPRSAWIYLGLFIVTIFWSLWEAGLDGWALVPRLLGPGILLVIVLALVPSFDGRGYRRWWVAPAGGAALLAAIFLLAGFSGTTYGVRGGALPPPMPAAAAPQTVQGIAVGADWPAFGGTFHALRYSPLSQINRNNVAKLEKAWSYHSDDLPEEPAAKSASQGS